MAGKHPGFAAVQKKIAGQGHSMASAGAILAAASRGASKSAKKSNPRLNKVKGKMHDGGIVPESGLYNMQKGETVIPIMEQHDSAMYSSEGSMPRKNNPCRYEKRADERKRLNVEEMSGKETDHVFGHTYKIDNQILADSPELLRRRNSRNRDYRTGNRITNNGIYANPVSPSGKE